MGDRFMAWSEGVICQREGCDRHAYWQVMDCLGQKPMQWWFCQEHAQERANELNEDNDG